MQVSSVPEELVQAASIDETVKRHLWSFYNHVIRACMAGVKIIEFFRRIKGKDNIISFLLVLVNIIYVRVANINICLPCICFWFAWKSLKLSGKVVQPKPDQPDRFRRPCRLCTKHTWTALHKTTKGIIYIHNRVESGLHLLTHLTHWRTEQSGCDPHVEVFF